MRILTVSPPSRIVWIYAWTASRTSCERFPCDVLPFRNSSISSRFSFSSRSVIRSFSSIRIPRLNRGKRYDEVIHHSAQFWRVVRRILGHGTYTCCQLSYDVGQRPPSRLEITPRMGLGFLFCMPYGRHLCGATNQGRSTLRFAAKSFTRIAPMCARGQEVTCPPRSTEKVAVPPRRETKRSTSIAGQAQAPSRPSPT